ncbi:ATPase family protein [Candidatus Magnetomorum sp. HK-1]|nr:ATPase family protein [Candidatus Magnetomorum sp. HK-1]
MSLTIEELNLNHCNMFWTKTTNVSDMEKLKVLSVTGGVPKYLEEIDTKRSAEENIKRICFQKEGYLFNEFNEIFEDSFKNRASTLA